MWGFCISGKRCSGVVLPGQGVNREEEKEEEGSGRARRKLGKSESRVLLGHQSDTHHRAVTSSPVLEILSH